MKRWMKITGIAVGSLAVLALLAATVLPVLVRNRAVDLLRETTGRNVRIEKLSFNPLTLTASVRGFAVEERDGGPFLTVGALRVSVSPASLYRRALVLSGVSIDAPALRIVRESADRFNFTDIAERLAKEEEKPKPAAVFPFVLNDFRLTGGSLDFEDRAVAGDRKHSLRNLEITLPRLSSLPAEAEMEAEPRIAAIVNGASLTAAGKIKPFGRERDASLRIALQKFSLPELMVYVPQAPPVDLASGRLTLDTDLRFRQPPDRAPELEVKGLVRFDDLALNLARGQPLFRLPVLEIRSARLEPLAGLFDIEAITLDGPELFASRDRRGTWMFQRLLQPAAGQAAKAPAAQTAAAGKVPPPTAAGHPPVAPRRAGRNDKAPLPGAGEGGSRTPQFSVAALSVKNGLVHFRDDLPRGGFSASVREITLAVQDASNRPGRTAQYDLSLKVDREIRLASRGSFTLADPAAKASFQLTGLPLQKGWPYLAEHLTAPLKGTVDLSGDVAFSETGGLTAEKGSLTLQNLSARYGSREGLDLERLTIEGAAFQQKANRVEVERIALSGGTVSLSREADGRISLLSLLVPREEGAAPGPEVSRTVRKAPSPKEAPPRPPAYRLKRFDLDRFDIDFTDRTRPQNPRFTLRGASLSLSGLSGPEPRPAGFRFAATFGQGAQLRAAGDLTPHPFRCKGDLRVGRLPIRDFEAYYPESLNFLILGGLLDLSLTLDIALGEGGATGGFRGSAGLSAFHAVDSVEEEDLLKWQRLQLDGIDGGLGPFRLAIGEVSLNEPFSRIIVREDGTLNLQDLIRKREKSAAAETSGKSPDVKESRGPDAAAPPAAPAAEKAAPPEIRIGAVTIADGTVSFTDKHLPNDFQTTFYRLGGRISGLSSEASLLADVDLRGNLENHSPLRITGRINPLREDLFVDLKFSFTDIELSPMSPYTETYLGYILKQGKLFLDLEYHIENRKLVSENRIRVDQFTFGEKVESEKATSLPVKLGLALLKDRRGEIRLDVPVTGRIDDPKFNIWRIVFQVIKNLLVKAVTAPFSLLSSLFAGDGDLSAVAFPPGSSTLLPSEEKKLEALAKGLADRPALKVSMTAYADREKDAEGYRNELLERRLKRERLLTLTRGQQPPEGESAGAPPLTPEERSTYLKAVYAREKFPKPRNAQGQEIHLPDPEMVKLILANTRVEREELEALARERLDAVRAFLIEKGGVPAEQVFQQNDDIFKPPVKEETPRSRVELNALAP